MLSAPSKEHLPAHSRDVCPWGATCAVHARPTFADQSQRSAEKKSAKRLKACGKCGGPRSKPGLRAYLPGGDYVPACAACALLGSLPKFLRPKAVAA